MATLTIRMSDSDAQAAKRFAEFEGKSFSDFAREAILERIEDYQDLQTLQEAIAYDDGKRFSHDEALKELGL